MAKSIEMRDGEKDKRLQRQRQKGRERLKTSGSVNNGKIKKYIRRERERKKKRKIE